MKCTEKGCITKQHGPRILLSLLFVVGGFGFLLNFKNMIGFVGTGLGNIGLPMSLATIALVIAIILKLGGFDPNFFLYFEDTDLCRRAHLAGWQVVYNPEASIIHNHKRQSAQTAWWKFFLSGTTRTHITSWFKYLWKYRFR
jgi:cellulose synthase/poly-beta-1,6-N-acetylglucosamine synthase-like glycosyltransferase